MGVTSKWESQPGVSTSVTSAVTSGTIDGICDRLAQPRGIMNDSFDAFEFVEYLRSRWRVPAAACGTAVLVALVVALWLPNRYTATASVVIEPPGGNDVRLSTAVSAVYLESLKTFETFASSDTLFARAAEKFHLGPTGRALEPLKRRVLKVVKPRDTKVLEISVTLPDAKLAQAVAQYIAEQTVSTSQAENVATDNLVSTGARQQVESARMRLTELQKTAVDLASKEPMVGMQSAIDSDVELLAGVRQRLVETQADAEEARAQLATGSDFAREQLDAATARATLLAKRAADLNLEIDSKSALLAQRSARRDALSEDLKVAQANYETASNQLHNMEVATGTHGEMLRLVDPGIVPGVPSSPNIPLYVVAALLTGAVSSLVFLSVVFAYRRHASGRQTQNLLAPISRGMRA